MKLIDIDIAAVKPHPQNPRIHPTSAIDKLVSSINHYGWTNPVLLSNDNVIIAGHARIKAAEKAGITKVPAIVLDMDANTAKAYMIADNKIQEETKWDIPLLKDLIQELDDNDFDIGLTGFSAPEVNQILDISADDIQEDDTDIDSLVDTAKEPITKLGDVWKLGDHILVCGDATKPEYYEKLLGDDKVSLLITDPPYNVDYEGEAGKIMNDNMSDDKFTQFIHDGLTMACNYMVAGGGFYVFYAFSQIQSMLSAMEQTELLLKQNLIWEKNHFVLGRQDYQWKHEPILYGWKKGAKHNWYGNFDKSTVIECDKPLVSKLHPTMKPIKLIAGLILNSSQKGELILDNHGGSGTTIMACEETGRKARVIELDPVFCDVIVERYKQKYKVGVERIG